MSTNAIDFDSFPGSTFEFNLTGCPVWKHNFPNKSHQALSMAKGFGASLHSLQQSANAMVTKGMSAAVGKKVSKGGFRTYTKIQEPAG